MGRLRDWAAKAPKASFNNCYLYSHGISYPAASYDKAHPIAGVSASLEAGSALESRTTLTRWAIAGPMALAMKKKSGGEWFLMIDGPDFQWAIEVARDKVAKAREFAMKVNTLARQADAAQPAQ